MASMGAGARTALTDTSIVFQESFMSLNSEEVIYDDAIVRKFVFATLIWGLVATAIGLFIAIELVLPGISGNWSFISFGRLRPLHTNAAIFAFAGNAVFTAVYYS